MPKPDARSTTVQPMRKKGEPAAPACATKERTLLEVELGMVSASHAFQRWIVYCMEVAGLRDMTIVDVLVLNHVQHRSQGKSLADICFILHIEDTHVVAYALRKLIGLGVIVACRDGKEVTYTTTPAGDDTLLRYAAVRERRLVDALKTVGLDEPVLGELAQYLRKMSGLYDQAARAASSL